MPVNDALLHNWFYGNYGVRLTAVLGFAFLMGSIPVGPVVRWLFAGLDPRVSRVAVTLIAPLNVLKGAIPTLIALHGAGQLIGLCSAFATTLGHHYCPWRRFAGGTGIDLVTGVVLAISPPATLVFLAFWCVPAIASGTVAIGTLVASALLFLPLWFFVGAPAALFGIAAGTAIVLRLRADGQSLERL